MFFILCEYLRKYPLYLGESYMIIRTRHFSFRYNFLTLKECVNAENSKWDRTLKILSWHNIFNSGRRHRRWRRYQQQETYDDDNVWQCEWMMCILSMYVKCERLQTNTFNCSVFPPLWRLVINETSDQIKK